MNEIKIRFKSGQIGYFKYDGKEDIEILFSSLGDAIKDNAYGVLEAIDLADDKKTIINFREIASFGYSKV